MLVYFDPWLAGVAFPSLIIVGLMAIPYIDTNPKGNGYFTFRERRWEITIFLTGFLVLWCMLIVLGTFLRGPNWNFFGPYEFWDLNKLVPLNNINLSEIIWIKLLKHAMPNFWLIREIFGLALVGFYVAALPLVFSKTLLRRFYEKMDPVRYFIGVSLAPDDAGAADQDVPALDLQPQVHRRDPRVRVQHLAEPTPCRASRPPSRSITTTTSRG